MKRHFILTSGRSGSNYLVNTLNLHPQIVNYGEILGEWTKPYKLYQMLTWSGMTWELYLNNLYYNVFFYYTAQAVSAWSHSKKRQKINFKRRCLLRSIGIKDFAFLLEKRGLIDYLKLSEDIFVIHLYRKNILKKYISLLRMKQTGVIGTTKSVRYHPVYIFTSNLIKELDQLHKEQKLEISIKESIAENRVLTICYENYFESGDSIAVINEKLFNFLGVSPLPLKSKMKKLGSDNLHYDILNYSEVYSVLKGTEYEGYLYE